MVDPWRNLPVTTMGIGQWFNHDFPPVIVDIGLSMHAHFDHDGLHRLYANMLMDRIVGEFSLGDVRIHDIAEKHVSDFSHCIYNFTEATMERGVDPRPPDNPRSWDNTLFVIETAGLRILHWGDNRPDPPEEVWRAIGEIDIELLPIDDSQHILSYEHVNDVLKRTRAKVCIPGHYRTCHRATPSGSGNGTARGGRQVLTDPVYADSVSPFGGFRRLVPPARFRAAARAAGYSDPQAWVLRIGETRLVVRMPTVAGSSAPTPSAQITVIGNWA